MIKPIQLFRFTKFVVALLLAPYLLGGTTAHAEDRIDNIPMYGQPEIPRPDKLKKADEIFIMQATSGFGGSREKASIAWYLQGARYMNEGDLDLAMRRFNQSWVLNQNSYLPFWGFGRVALERNNMDEAIKNLEKAIELCDDDYQKVGLLSDTGTAYSYKAASIPENMQNERSLYFQKANSYFNESTTLNPSYANSWKRWAHSLYREGNYSESWIKIKEARSLGATDTDYFVNNLAKKMPEPD